MDNLHLVAAFLSRSRFYIRFRVPWSIQELFFSMTRISVRGGGMLVENKRVCPVADKSIEIVSFIDHPPFNQTQETSRQEYQHFSPFVL